ncbi:SMI1/KNR4 family protein [Streptomyces sp. NPDC054854]
MDALIGTQVPRHRLTDPASAVGALEQAVPGLALLRRTAPAGIEWAAVEECLPTELPSDFKLLADSYPSLVFGDFLCVGFPNPGQETAWSEDSEDLEILAEWCADAEMFIPLHPFPALGGLLPWATSTQGDYFCWNTTGPGPDGWTVTVASRNGGWWHYTAGAVQFIADLISGALELWGLPSVRPRVEAF